MFTKETLAGADKHVREAAHKLGRADELLMQAAEVKKGTRSGDWGQMVIESTALSTNASTHLSAAVEIRIRLAGPR